MSERWSEHVAEREREIMLDVQLARRGIRDQNVLTAMRAVPRERFVPDDLMQYAYEDGPLPIGEGQTISQPYIVAAMIEAASLDVSSRVLEVGAGSGYAAAVMGQIARQVVAIERHAVLARAAAERLELLGCDNVDIRIGDGTLGLPGESPFDAILVVAGAPVFPEALKRQLAIGGRLVIPVGASSDQGLCRIVRRTAEDYEASELGRVRFVPLVGEQGWTEQGMRCASNSRSGT